MRLVVCEGLEADLPMASLVDPAKERLRLGRQAAALEKELAGLERRMASPNFALKASPDVVAATHAMLTEKKEALAVIARCTSDLEQS
jgi:valyl-tRNA synthetase